MENQNQPAQPRRSQRQARGPERLQLGEGVRHQRQRELPYQRMERRRREAAARREEERARLRAANFDAAREIVPAAAQGPPAAAQEPQAAPPAAQEPLAAPQAAPDLPAAPELQRPAVQIIADHKKYAKNDKSCNEVTFVTKITPRLATLLLALYYGAPTELSKLFSSDADFQLSHLELNYLHSKNLPFDFQPVSVLTVYTSDLVRDLQTPFLFKLTTEPPVYDISLFLQNYFKMSLLSDQFLKKLAILAFSEAAGLQEDFIVGIMKASLANAEINAVEARFFCLKCFSSFEKEAQLLSHVGNFHNWALKVNTTEENSSAIKDREYLIGISKWKVSKSHRTMVADEYGANAHVARYEEVELQGLVDGQRHGEAVLLRRDGVHFQGNHIPNPDSDQE